MLVPVGIQREDVPVPLGSWTLREYTIVGTVAHAIAADLPRAVELLAGRADWTDVADEVLPLDEVAAVPSSRSRAGVPGRSRRSSTRRRHGAAWPATPEAPARRSAGRVEVVHRPEDVDR